MSALAAVQGVGWAGAGGAAGAVRLAGAMIASLGVHAGAALLIDLPAGPDRALATTVSVRLVAAPGREPLRAIAPRAASPAPPATESPRVPSPLRPVPHAEQARVVARPDGETATAPRTIAPASSARRATATRRERPESPPVPAPAAESRDPQPAVGARTGPAVASARAAGGRTGRRSSGETRAPAAAAAESEAPRRAAAASRSTLATPAAVPPRPAAGNPPPSYPLIARRRGQQGRVLLRLEVAPDGTASAAAIVRSSGVAALDRAAREAVARWRFEPARRGGRAVPATVEVPVLFRLDERG